MTGAEVDDRLRRLAKDRRWLAAETGYEWVSLRDCLAPGSKKGISPKMAAKIEAALSKAEAEMPPAPGDLLGAFTPDERRAIVEHASREGYPGPHSWILAKIRALLAMMSATRGKG